MIVGIGTDIVSIERIAKVLGRHGARFVRRVLTPEERPRFERWAAKEAFSKAIGTGIHAPFTWQSISIGRDPKGKPLVVPSREMARHLEGLGVARAHISLSDDAGMAVAFVVLESP